MKLKAPHGTREYHLNNRHRFFKYQMAPDEIISLALMAHHRGASIRGIQNMLETIFHVRPCAESIIRWYRKFAKSVCLICLEHKSMGNNIFCSQRASIVRCLEDRCRFFKPSLLDGETLLLAVSFFQNSDQWKPYGSVGRPGKVARYDQKEWERRYARNYYATHPEYAKKLVKNPDRLYSRLALKKLSPKERLERKRRYKREWARKKYRKSKKGKIDEEMSRRGRMGAEIRWGRKYT